MSRIALVRNQLIGWALDSSEALTERVLWVDDGGDAAIVIDIAARKALPRLRRLDEFTSALATGHAWFPDQPPSALLAQAEDCIPSRQREARDRGWAAIEPLVGDDFVRVALDSKFRGQRIRERARSTGLTKNTVFSHLRRYWQGGLCRNALLPKFMRCGAPGVDRLARSENDPKRGRPSCHSRVVGRTVGMNITPRAQAAFRAAIKKYYETAEEPSLKKVFERAIADSFPETESDPDGERLPTLGQFYYWHSKMRSPVRETIARKGMREFNLTYRALTGDPRVFATGPGCQYQIDSTSGDIALVSSLDRSSNIGRPVIYMVVDVFSRMITGFSDEIEGPSWLGAALALENAFTDKVSFAAQYGITISQEDWPCFHLPDEVYADRAELLGDKADVLPLGLNVRVGNAEPYRPDWKGVVERSFRLANADAFTGYPGRIRKVRRRGAKDPRLEASLTLQGLRKLLISHILEHNLSTRISGYPRSEDMIADHVEPVPIELWNWGIRKRSSYLRVVPRDEVRAHLLPRAKATVTGEGICLHGLHYTCPKAVAEQWFARARIRGSWTVELSYHPRSTDSVFLWDARRSRFEVCMLLDVDSAYRGRDLYEIRTQFERDSVSEAIHERKRLRAKPQILALRDSIVAEEVALTKASKAKRGPVSNRKQLASIRENRRREREANGASDAWTKRPSEGPSVGTVLPFSDDQDDAAAYVAPPTDLDVAMIRLADDEDSEDT